MTQRLIVGRILAAHGIGGECVVDAMSDAPQRFERGSVLGADRFGEITLLTVRSSRPHKAKLLVRFDEVPDRSEAEAFRGAWLTIPAEDAAPLPEGLYYAHEIVGFDVVDPDGESLGVLHEVLEYPAQDLWVVRTPDKRKVMVPAVKEFVRDVAVGDRRIVIAPIPGLFDD